jgi:type II secretory pathway pseudopilin PulG
MAARDTTERERGFTLIEALIGLVVTLLVVTATLGLLDTQRKANRTTRVRSEVQQNARYTLDMITRDLMEAGQGMDPNAVFGVVAASDGGSANSDTLYVIFADAGTPIHLLKAPPAGEEKTTIVVKISCSDPVDDLAEGTFVYVASGSARGIARVNTVSRNQSPGGGCGGNPNADLGEVTLDVTVVDGEGHGWVLQGNELGAALVRANAAVYFVDKTDPNNPILARATSWNGGWEALPIAYGVSDLEVELRFANGAAGEVANGDDTNPDNDFDDIDTIHIRVKGQARSKDKDVQGGRLFEQEYAVSVSPRNQLYTRNRN